MKVYGSVYLITNTINKKLYVGITTVNIKRRFYQHINDSMNKKRCKALHLAIAKYGEENFKIDEVCCCLDKTSLIEAEKYLIKVYNSKKNGYNLTNGGEGNAGYEWSLDQRNKMKEKYTGGKHPLCMFTIDELKEIKKRLKNNTIKDTAKEFNCSRETIRQIIAGKTYKNMGINFSSVANINKKSTPYKYVYWDKKYRKYIILIKNKYYGKCLAAKEAHKKVRKILQLPEPEL